MSEAELEIDGTRGHEVISLEELVNAVELTGTEQGGDYQKDEILADETSFLLQNQDHHRSGNETILPWLSNRTEEASRDTNTSTKKSDVKRRYKKFRLKTFKVKQLPVVNFDEFKLNPENYKRKSPLLMILQEGVSYLYDQHKDAIVGKFDLNGQFFHRLYLQQFPPSIIEMMKANQWEQVTKHPLVTKIRQEQPSAYYSNWV